MPQVPKPHTIAWPLTPKSAEDIDQNFDALFRQVQLNASSGVLPVSLGGTGLPSFVTGDLLYATGPSTLAGLHDIATGNALLSGGVNTAPSYGKVGLATHVSGILPEANGGTNQSTYAQGDLIYASALNTLAKLAKDANATRYLSNTGASNAPAWAQVNLGNGVTGTLPATNGGTGHASFVVGDLLYASSTTVLSRLAGVAFGDALISFGVNSAPGWGKISDAHISDVTEGKITDGSILARLAANETITGSWTFSQAAPSIKFVETDAAANAQKWRLIADSSQFALQVLSDNEVTQNSAFIVTRSGSTITGVAAAFPWEFSGNCSALGAWTFTGNVTLTNSAPLIDIIETGVAADNGRWDYVLNGGLYRFRLLSDDGLTVVNAWSVGRTGTTPTLMTIGSPLTVTGAVLPLTDNAYTCGNASLRWSLVRGVTITPGDLLFENGWVITEADKYGITTPGLVILDSNDDLVVFIEDGGTIYADVRPLAAMPAFVRTTLEERTGHPRP